MPANIQLKSPKTQPNEKVRKQMKGKAASNLNLSTGNGADLMTTNTTTKKERKKTEDPPQNFEVEGEVERSRDRKVSRSRSKNTGKTIQASTSHSTEETSKKESTEVVSTKQSTEERKVQENPWTHYAQVVSSRKAKMM
eukprot:TRINITY_DN17799_c0_g1_i1.p1 TRINITY_DN17799_c0_g1~~TRINITY_DN17799_c0_g1_i1.p1  ORF type:complete len:158 (-),score=49.26 TRINITY_DN17799_c0_g1_i1:460-876(-)